MVCLRIGHCADEPAGPRDLAVWLSPDDAGRLVEAAIHATGWHLVWGVSANTHRWWSGAGGEAIDYHPHDDASARSDLEPEPHDNALVGGMLPDEPLGRR